MKQKHLLSLLQGGFTTIQVVFNDESANRAHFRLPALEETKAPWTTRVNAKPIDAPTVKRYTYKAPLSADVKAGDTVVVVGRTGLAVALVERVDPVARIDLDADFDYKWIVQKVDLTEYNKQVEAEIAFNDTMQEVERAKQREALLGQFKANLAEGSEARALFDRAVESIAGKTLAAPAPAARAAAPSVSEDLSGGMQCR